MLTGQGPSLVSSKPWRSVHHFILPTTLGSRCCCSRRMDGETEARRGSVTCSRPHGLAPASVLRPLAKWWQTHSAGVWLREAGRLASCACGWQGNSRTRVLIFLTQHLRRPAQSTRCTGPSRFSAGPAPWLWEVLSHLFSFWGTSAVLLEDWSEIPGPARIPALRLTSGLATRAFIPLLSTPGTGAGDPG